MHFKEVISKNMYGNQVSSSKSLSINIQDLNIKLQKHSVPFGKRIRCVNNLFNELQYIKKIKTKHLLDLIKLTEKYSINTKSYRLTMLSTFFIHKLRLRPSRILFAVNCICINGSMIVSICKQTKETHIRLKSRFRRDHEGHIPDNLLNKYAYSTCMSDFKTCCM